MKKKKLKVIPVVILLIILISGGFVAYSLLNNKTTGTGILKKLSSLVEIKKLKVYDTDSNKRPIAIMIPNDSWGGAQDRHYNLQQAYMVYEIYAEGSITRLMALYKDVDLDKIGPIRSARSYYIDYAMENDALYVHWGHSDGAQEDFYTYSLNHIECLAYDGTICQRNWDLSAPNNGFISTSDVYSLSSEKGYRLTSDNYKVLNYSINDVDYKNDETYTKVDALSIKYSNIYTVNYKYDEENKYYLRFNNDEEHIDNSNNEQIHAKNIIYLDMDIENTYDEKNHINLLNIGTNYGYYISNGYAIKIKAVKNSRTEKTKYYDMNDNELVINDGNTFIQIACEGALTLKTNEEE